MVHSIHHIIPHVHHAVSAVPVLHHMAHTATDRIRDHITAHHHHGLAHKLAHAVKHSAHVVKHLAHRKG